MIAEKQPNGRYDLRLRCQNAGSGSCMLDELSAADRELLGTFQSDTKTGTYQVARRAGWAVNVRAEFFLCPCCARVK